MVFKGLLLDFTLEQELRSQFTPFDSRVPLFPIHTFPVVNILVPLRSYSETSVVSTRSTRSFSPRVVSSSLLLILASPSWTATSKLEFNYLLTISS